MKAESVFWATALSVLMFPAQGRAAAVEPIKVYANQVNWAVDPSWSLQEKQDFVTGLRGLSQNLDLPSPSALRLSPQDIFDSEGYARATLPPQSAAAQVLGEILARPKLIPSVAEALRMSGLDGGENTAQWLRKLSERIEQQIPQKRFDQLRQLSRIRKELYKRGLNKGDLSLWAQNHLNALHDGERRYRFVPPSAPLEELKLVDAPMIERLFPLAPSQESSFMEKWDTEALPMPESFDPKRHLVSISIPKPGHYALPRKGFNGDLPTYVQGDVSARANIGGDHHHVFIAGELGEESSVSIREGIVSARALGARSRLSGGGGMLVIIGDAASSRGSDMLSSRRATTVIEVPENRRADIFLLASG